MQIEASSKDDIARLAAAMGDDLVCWNCGKPGHFKGQCQEPPRDGEGSIFAKQRQQGLPFFMRERDGSMRRVSNDPYKAVSFASTRRQGPAGQGKLNQLLFTQGEDGQYFA